MNPEDEIETKIHVSNISGIKVGDYIYACAGWKEKFNQQSTQITELMARIDNQTVRISELETDLAQEEHNSEAFMDEISRLVLYIVDLESKIAALKKIAEEERAAMLACAEDLHGIDEGHLIEARRQLSEEHPEAFK